MRQKPRPVRATIMFEESKPEASASSGALPEEGLTSLVTSMATTLAQLQSQVDEMTQRQRRVVRDFGLLVKLMSKENRRRLRLEQKARKIVRRSRLRCRSQK